MTRTERIVLASLLLVAVLSLGMLLRQFRNENTELVPVQGGTYIEGSVGDVLPLNPWFTITNDVNRDIVSLVFSGLLRYDPASGKIVEDLATMKVSDDARIYTLTLKPDLQWHDSTPTTPHPVTADDVVFTFATIQEPDFPNDILHQNFRGVEIEKLDDRTVRFKLEKPYSFFPSNLTLGLLPQKAFEGVPVAKLDQTLDFAFHPVGAGPYSFLSLLQTDVSTEVTLKRFDRDGLTPFKLDRVVFRVFPDYNSLLTDILNLSAVRLVPRNEQGQPILPRRFTAVPYVLPQYVGLFFNLDHDIVKDRFLRLGLQLATDKRQIADSIHETQIVDTPLAELDLGDWHYQFDAKAAQGALFESDWNVPEKLRLQKILEQQATNTVGPLKGIDAVVLMQTGSELTLSGATKDLRGAAFINGIRILSGSVLEQRERRSMSGVWLVTLPAGRAGSGALQLGLNILKLTDSKGRVVDSAYIERQTDAGKYRLATQEQQLVTQFQKSKDAAIPAAQRITVDDLYLENGYLRRKRAGDEPHTRVNARGEPLRLTLLTSRTPDTYAKIAAQVQKEWKAIGADVQVVVPDTKKEFEDRMVRRDYDIVLFGQSLLDNLDSYPYWHSSQIQDTSDDKKFKQDAFNLSQYASFEADALLTQIRETANADVRGKALKKLNDIFKRDVPAVFLYSPLYVYAYDDHIRGVTLGKLALHSDRFLTLHQSYISTQPEFKDGKNWLSFFPWLLHYFL